MTQYQENNLIHLFKQEIPVLIEHPVPILL